MIEPLDELPPELSVDEGVAEAEFVAKHSKECLCDCFSRPITCLGLPGVPLQNKQKQKQKQKKKSFSCLYVLLIVPFIKYVYIR